MTPAFATSIPSPLIRQLFESARAAGAAALPPDQRAAAVSWLRRVLIDFEALDQHIALLQQLYESPFRYSTPRRDRIRSETPQEPPDTSKFRFKQRLPDRQITAILDEGVESLPDDQFGPLLLNPFALYDLFDVIDDVQPDRWLKELQVFAEESSSMDSAGLASSQGQLQPTSLAPDSDEFWHRLQQAVDAAVSRASSSVSQKTELARPIRPGLNGRSSKARIYTLSAAAAVACCVSIAALWIGSQAISNQRDLQAQLAQLSTARNSNGGLELQAAQGSQMNLQQLRHKGYLNLQDAKDDPDAYLKKIERVALPEVNALIHEFQQNGLGPLQIIQRLRDIAETNDKAVQK